MASKLDEATRKDPKIRATLIFFQFQSGKSIFVSYKELCNRMGSKFMDYLEFEFWWQRFSVGSFDLDYDRSKEPKYRTITDMPVQIFEKICENLGDNYKVKYWFILRRVSKSFHTIVDSWRVPSEKIDISCYESSIYLKFDGFEVDYFRKSENSSEIRLGQFSNKLVFSGNFQDLAADDLMSALVSPGGYKLQKLNIQTEIDNGFAQKLFDKSRNLATNIHVDTVVLNHTDPISFNNVSNSLQSIKEIDIQSEFGLISQEFVDTINEITALKNVEMVKMYSFRDGDKNSILSSLKAPKLELRSRIRDPIPADHLLRIVQMLLEAPNLQYCTFDATSRGIIKLEKGIKKFGAEEDPRNRNIFNYPIPDSKEFFEIEIQRNNQLITGISIERKYNSS